LPVGQEELTPMNRPTSLVTTEQLFTMIGHRDLRLYDCTTYIEPAPRGSDLPYLVVSGRKTFEDSHIPGADFLDLQREFSESATRLNFMMPPVSQLEESLGRHGVDVTKRVVLYSIGTIMWATRFWWMLRSLGLDALVLDGGFDKWAAEERAVERGRAKGYPATTFKASPRSGLFVDKSAVLASLNDPSAVIVNALGPKFHRGLEPSRYGRRRIPGSVNVPAMTLVNAADVDGGRGRKVRGGRRHTGQECDLLLRRRHLGHDRSVYAGAARLRPAEPLRWFDGRMGEGSGAANRDGIRRCTILTSPAERGRCTCPGMRQRGEDSISLRAGATFTVSGSGSRWFDGYRSCFGCRRGRPNRFSRSLDSRPLRTDRVPVRALVRREDERSLALARLGAEVVVGDLLELEDIHRAIEGCRRAYFGMSVSAGYLETTVNFAALAKHHMVEAVVNISQMTVSQMSISGTTSSPQQKQHWLGEQVLNWSNLPVVHVRPTVFLDGFFLRIVARGIATRNVLSLPFGKGKTSPIAGEDVGKAIAAILKNPKPHLGKIYNLAGAQAQDMTEVAAAYGRALGRTITYEDVPLEKWRAGLAELNQPEHLVRHLTTMAVLHQQNRYDRLIGDFEKLTGSRPVSVEAFVRRHSNMFAAQFNDAQAWHDHQRQA
jgi:thiosulfate/3-mercaptopyruvate sulfurtransferase